MSAFALGATSVAHALVELSPSSYLASVPDPPCDVTITTANAGTTLSQLDDPTKRVFCVAAGDYRSYLGRNLNASGTPSAPRYLRYDGPGAVKAFQRSNQALFERINVYGSWWVVQGLTLLPKQAGTERILTLIGADHVVVDGNLIDAIEHPNGNYQTGVFVQGRYGDPATDNTIQRNVIRNGDQSHQAGDYIGVQIRAGQNPGEDNDRNRVLDNEISDWGDGVAVAGYALDCSEPGEQHGTVIDGNDVYVTPAKYVDCASGAPDPEGGCSCAENGIDVKASPAGPAASSWTRITRNRLWGFRPTTEAVTCGGSGALGQAITAGNPCASGVAVARNLIADATIGVDVGGADWIIAGNLVHDIQPSDGEIYGTQGLVLGQNARDIRVEWNTITDSLNAYDDPSDDTDTRCNVIVRAPESIGSGLPRGQNHLTSYNYLYASGWSNMPGPTNQLYEGTAESGNRALCYERRRWTGPEVICEPEAALGAASPHRYATPFCDAAIGAPFGIASIGFWDDPPAMDCGLGGEVAVLLFGLRAARRRLRRSARPALP